MSNQKNSKKINSSIAGKQMVKVKSLKNYRIFKMFFMRSTISFEANGFKM